MPSTLPQHCLLSLFSAALGCAEHAVFWGRPRGFSVLPAGQGRGAVGHLPSILILASARSLHGCEESGAIQPSHSEPQGKTKCCPHHLLDAHTGLPRDRRQFLLSGRIRRGWLKARPAPHWLCHFGWIAFPLRNLVF